MNNTRTINECIFINQKSNCCGCESCAQICPKSAIEMKEDDFGFRYPSICEDKCINCGLCKKVCPFNVLPALHENKQSYGGYIVDDSIRNKSTSGGAFSAFVRVAFRKYKENLIVYGAVADGINVKHEEANSLYTCEKFCSSKYCQSNMKNIYKMVGDNLNKAKNVLFSGTPCQIAGLYNYLSIKNVDINNLLTLEVLCAGVATPLLFRKYDKWLQTKYKGKISKFYWRYKNHNRWDYNCCKYILDNGNRRIIDRWFSGYWSLFTQRLLMRPSCEVCPFKGKSRVADITLGDLWGVDKEYPQLYNGNKGVSWILLNTQKANLLFNEAKLEMITETVDFNTMEKYQIPSIRGKELHPLYNEFMKDLISLDYPQLCKKWARKPSLKLLFQKYIYNNHMRVRIWKVKQFIKGAIK